MLDRTDEETGELIREWLQKYGLFLLAGMIFVIVAIAGYRWWQERKDQQRSEQAGYLMSLYQDVESHNLAEAKKDFAKIKSDGELFAFGNLLMARLSYHEHDTSAAIKYLDVAAQSKDSAVANLAVWQRAKLHIATGKSNLAEKDLQLLKGTLFAKDIPQLEGILQQTEGKLAAAADSYQQAASNPLGETLFKRQASIVKAALSLDKQDGLAEQGSKNAQ